MKVTTDACIQGAWTPLLPGVRRVLDIGAGTGLLSLMLAQRQPGAVIDAVEIDDRAARQAAGNVANSRYHGRINVMAVDARRYEPAEKYELIISNPPFFNNSLLGSDAAANKARHTLAMSFGELAELMSSHLAPAGYVSVMLPVPEFNLFYGQMIAGGFHEWGKLVVRHDHKAVVKRVVGVFGKQAGLERWDEELVIKDIGGSYSARFRELLSPFYLAL